MSFLTSYCSNEQPPVDLANPRAQILGTPRNLWIFGLYFFCSVFMLANSIGFLWYFTFMSFVYFQLSGLVSLPFSTYNQVIIGYYGDKIETRWGRRKPCVAIATIVILICIVCLSFPPGGFALSNQKVLFGWSALFLTILYMANDWLSVPLNSWLIESTADNEDFIKISTIPRNIGTALGGICGFVTSSILPHYLYSFIAVVLAAIGTTVLLYYVPNTRLREAPKQPDLIPSLRTCMRSKEFKTIFTNKCFLFSGLGIAGGLLTYLFVIGFFPAIECYSDVIPVLVVIGVVGALGTIIVQASFSCILAKYDKLKTYIVLSYIAASIAFAIFPISLIKGFTGFYLVIFMSLLIGWSLVALQLVDTFFVRDLIVFDQFITGLRRENMYQTAMILPSQLCINIASVIPIAIVNMSGLVANTGVSTDDQIISRFSFNDATYWQLRIYSSFLVGILVIFSNRLMKTYALNDKIAAKLNVIVKQREEDDKTLVIGGVNPITMDSKVDTDSETPRKSIVVPKLVDETDEDLMYMNHLSGAEVEIINENFKNLASLKTKIYFSVLFSIVCMAVNIASMGLQINTGNGIFVTLTMTIILFASLYILYEGLRLRVINKLGDMMEEKAKFIIQKALVINKQYFKIMAAKMKECGIDDSGDNERESLAAPDPDDKEDVPLDERSIVGYKRIIFLLLIFIIYGICGCTVLNFKQHNPDNHTPTMSPSLMPSAAATIRPLCAK